MSRALILMYHLIDTARSEQERRFCTTPDEFDRQIAYLAASGYTPLSMAQLCDCMQGEVPMPDKAVHITFDDGFTCVLDHAAPVLQRYGFPATMFALSDRLGSTNDWMTSRGFPERTLLSARRDSIERLEVSAKAMVDLERVTGRPLRKILSLTESHEPEPAGSEGDPR